MGRPPQCNPCCGRQARQSKPGFCTHRRYDDAGSSSTVEWSRNISPTSSIKAAVLAMTTGGGSVFSSGVRHRQNDDDHVIEARDTNGVLLWRTGVPSQITDLAYSGSALWAVGADFRAPNTGDNVYKLDPSNGAILWKGRLTLAPEGSNAGLHPKAVTPDGAGGVFIGGVGFSTSFNFTEGGFIIRLDSDGAKVSQKAFTSSFQAAVFDLQLGPDGFLYVAGIFRDYRCGGGAFAPIYYGPAFKMSTDYELQWVRTTRVIPTHASNLVVTSDAVFLGLDNGCVWKIDPDTAEVLESKSATGVAGGAIPCAGVNDMAAAPDGSVIYVVTGWHLVAHSASDLSVSWCAKNGGVIDGEQAQNCYKAVATGAGSDVYAGGYATACDPSLIDPAPSCSAEDCDAPTCEPCHVGPFGGVCSHQCEGDEIPCTVQMPLKGFGCFEGINTLVPMVLTPTEVGECRWLGKYVHPCLPNAENPLAPELKIEFNYEVREVAGAGCSGWSMRVTPRKLGGHPGCVLPAKDATILDCSCDHTDASTGTAMGHPWFDWSVSWTSDELLDDNGCPCCESGGFGPGPGVDVCGCTGVPETLFAAVSGDYVGTVPLVWNGTSSHVGSFTSDGCVVTLTFSCNEPNANSFELITGSIDCSGCGGGTTISDATSCDPFLWSGSLLWGGSCPLGASGLTVTITE